MGGESRQKVELGELIDQLLKDVRSIDGNAELSRGDKTKRLTRLAARLKNTLYEDRRRKDEDKLAASSYRRYLTTIRKAVTAQNWRHHSLEEAISRMAKRHPRWAEQLEEMGSHAHISDVRLAHRDLLVEVRRAGDAGAYDDIRAMKLDHEIMRHLTLPAATKADLAEEQAEHIEERSTNTVEINYHWLMATIDGLLNSQQLRADGSAAPYFSHLALGLALATGRREIEVLKLAHFKKLGEFEIEFSGQAKRREGVDYSETFRIYTLVKADEVLEAFAALRALPEVLELQHLSNVEVNRRVAKTLNTLAKRVFGSEERVFKDSRSIWARIVFERYFARDSRWKKVNEDVFWQEMLGHEGMKSQIHYKAFKIDYVEPVPAAGAVPGKWANRLEALQSLDRHERIGASSSLYRIHQWVKATVKAAPEARISQKAIATNVGSFRQNIKEYLEIAAEALATPNHSLEAVALKVPDQVAKGKPRLVAHKLQNGAWRATATVNGIEVASAEDADRMQAMAKAFKLAVGS
jgi:hypothetical protein